jgi:hypothetical protein
MCQKQESLKVELSLAEARLESAKRKLEAELRMEAERQVRDFVWLLCNVLQCCACFFVGSK